MAPYAAAADAARAHTAGPAAAPRSSLAGDAWSSSDVRGKTVSGPFSTVPGGASRWQVGQLVPDRAQRKPLRGVPQQGAGSGVPQQASGSPVRSSERRESATGSGAARFSGTVFLCPAFVFSVLGPRSVFRTFQ